MAAENQLAVQWPGEGGGKDAGTMAIPTAALEQAAQARQLTVIDLPDGVLPAALQALKACPLTSGALYVFVGSEEANGKAAEGSPEPPLTQAALAAAVAEAEAGGQYALVVTQGAGADLVATVRSALSAHVPEVVPPPFRPLVVAGPFGTGVRPLLQQLFQSLPGRFASPVVTTTKPSSHPEVDDRHEMHVVSSEEAAALAASGALLFHSTALGHVYGVQTAAVQKITAAGKVCVIEVDGVETARKLRDSGFEAVSRQRCFCCLSGVEYARPVTAPSHRPMRHDPCMRRRTCLWACPPWTSCSSACTPRLPPTPLWATSRTRRPRSSSTRPSRRCRPAAPRCALPAATACARHG